jgi:hypothetical protein
MNGGRERRRGMNGGRESVGGWCVGGEKGEGERRKLVGREGERRWFERGKKSQLVNVPVEKSIITMGAGELNPGYVSMVFQVPNPVGGGTVV